MKIVVLDYNNGNVYVYIVNTEPKDCEEYIIKKGHSLSNCEWMITKNEIIIK